MDDLQKPQEVADDVVVSIEYSLTVDGNVVDASEENEPLEYLQGYRNIIPGLERELAGMKIGESREVVVLPKDAYGESDPEAIIDIPRSEFPDDIEVKPGLELQLKNQDDEILNAVVISVAPETVTLDLNHPLAGKELIFQVKVVELRAATDEERSHGHVHGHDADYDEEFDEEDYLDDEGEDDSHQ